MHYCAFTNKNDGSFVIHKVTNEPMQQCDVNNVIYKNGMTYCFNLNDYDATLLQLETDINKKYEPFLQQLSFVIRSVKNGAPLIIDTTITPAEIELNRCWLYGSDDDEPIGETNFVVSELFVKENYKNCPNAEENDSYDEFLETYVPEEDGQFLYELAKEKNHIIEDIGENYY